MNLVSDDVNGASWRRETRSEQQYDSTLGEAFNNARVFVPLGPPPSWRRDQSRQGVSNAGDELRKGDNSPFRLHHGDHSLLSPSRSPTSERKLVF